MGEFTAEKKVREAAIELYNSLRNKCVDIISAGSATLKENGKNVITVWIGSISEGEKEILPEVYEGHKVLYTFYNPPSFF